MLKQSWGIYKKDLKTIFTNYAVLITIIVLCILPSLYAWINIKASWDPYASEATSRIKVAVVNNDEGNTLNGKVINIGKEVVANLKANGLLGWQFLDEDEAMKNLREGKIYAVIIIPQEFSSDLTSIITNNVRKAQIKYIVNEKLNAIAPKITDKGATGIETTVSQEVTGTISEIVLGKAKELGIQIEDAVLPKLVELENGLKNIEGRFTDINEFLNQTITEAEDFDTFLGKVTDSMPQLEQLIKDVQELGQRTGDFVDSTEEGINTLAPTIKQDIGLVSELSGETYAAVEGLQQAIEEGLEKAPEIVSDLLSKVGTIKDLTQSLSKILKIMDQLSNKQELSTMVAQLEDLGSSLSEVETVLNQISTALENGAKPDLTAFTDIKTILKDIENISSDIYNNFDDKIQGAIEGILTQLNTVLEDSDQVLSEVQDALPEVSDLLANAQDLLGKGEQGLEAVKEIMPTLEEKLTLLTDKVEEVNQSKELKDILNLIKEDVKQRSDFLANSTTIVEETIFPMGNYGTQMAPFYSSLASWVGLTILVSMISVDVQGKYKSYEVYFGKLLTYLSLTLVQGMIIALGDLYLLRIYCLRPWLFILSMLYISVAFTFIVYSLVSIFGNVGKVVAIVVMILQVAGSGGTFPVQLTSKFFININPYLPFTYAISLLRESIGGIEREIFILDIVVLGGFIIASLILALLLKRYVNKALEGFVHKYHEGGL